MDDKKLLQFVDEQVKKVDSFDKNQSQTMRNYLLFGNIEEKANET